MEQKKSLGQHWLTDEKILQEIVDLLEISSGDNVVEIGPGKGAVTKYLLQSEAAVTAVEFDDDLAAKLSDLPGLKVVNQDFLEFNLESQPGGYKVVGNIPYYITGKIVQKCLNARNKPSIVVLLVQKEVAERMAAQPGELSILGVLSQYYAEVSLGPVATADKFDPPPKVDSQVVILRPYNITGTVPAEKAFIQVVKAGFSARRKKLHTAMAGGLNTSVENAKKLLLSAQIDSNLRAQELSIADWKQLAEAKNRMQM